MEREGLHLHIRGRVQGVGFRYFVLENAQALALTGWVRNVADGHVEVEAEGSRPTLETFLSRVRRGPLLARVEAVELDWHPVAHPPFHSFDIR